MIALSNLLVAIRAAQSLSSPLKLKIEQSTYVENTNFKIEKIWVKSSFKLIKTLFSVNFSKFSLGFLDYNYKQDGWGHFNLC